MPRLVYEYLYVNFWILFFLTLFWANDGYISFVEGCIMAAVSIVGLASVAKKQLRTPGSWRIRKPFS